MINVSPDEFNFGPDAIHKVQSIRNPIQCHAFDGSQIPRDQNLFHVRSALETLPADDIQNNVRPVHAIVPQIKIDCDDVLQVSHRQFLHGSGHEIVSRDLISLGE